MDFYFQTEFLLQKAVDASQEVAHVLPQDSAESTTELPDMQPKPTPTSSPPSSQPAALSASAIQTETRADQHEVGENKYEYEKEQLEIREKEGMNKVYYLYSRMFQNGKNWKKKKTDEDKK